MDRIALTKNIVNIANQLDSMKLYDEANDLTKVAKIIAAQEDMKQDPMVFNPDETFESEQQENTGDAWNEAMAALHELMESGELSQSDFNQIESILHSSDDTKEMSYKDEDDDFDEEMMDEDHNAWQYQEDESDLDDMEHKQRSDHNHMHNFDEDDF